MRYELDWIVGAAWVLANGTIQRSRGPIASVTRTGAGQYTINFSPAVPLTDSVFFQVYGGAGNAGGACRQTGRTVNQLFLETCQAVGTLADKDFVMEIHRTLQQG